MKLCKALQPLQPCATSRKEHSTLRVANLYIVSSMITRSDLTGRSSLVALSLLNVPHNTVVVAHTRPLRSAKMPGLGIHRVR